MERRDVLKAVTVAAGASAAGGLLQATAGSISAADLLTLDKPRETVRGDMRYRQLGRTGEEISAIGLGGYHIGTQKTEAESIRIIRSAIDAGITFMDNCWDYHDGGSETRMGKALADGYRKRVFLMTKIDGRTRKEAARQIDQCLSRLRTDHIDLMQHHEIIRMEDGDRVFSDGGANEAVVAAQKAGKIRYIGFTGHKDPVVHLRMLEVAEQHNFHFDAAQMPINVMDAHFRSFSRDVVPVLLKEQIGILGMKPLGSGDILKSGAVKATECLHFALTMPTSVVITGIDSMARLKQALDAVKTFKPLSREGLASLLARTKQHALTGKFEKFKTDAMFDGTAQHPEWMGEPPKLG